MIARRERAAAMHADSHRLEVIACRESHVEADASVWFVRHLFRPNARDARAFVERNVLDETDSFDARQRPQSIHEREIESRERGTIVQLRIRWRDLKREDVPRLVAGIHVTQRPEAPYEQPGSNQEHECQRRLANDEPIARPVALARGTAPAVAQSSEIGLGSANRGNESARQRGYQRCTEREEHRRDTEMHLAKSRNVRR